MAVHLTGKQMDEKDWEKGTQKRDPEEASLSPTLFLFHREERDQNRDVVPALPV